MALFTSIKIASLDHLYNAGRVLKESLIGGGGLEGLKSGLRTPVKNTVQGIKNMGVPGNLMMAGMMGPGMYFTMTDSEAGPVQKAGKAVGILLPAYTLGHASIGSRAPGMLGAEALGGGMIIHKGALEYAGEKVDDLLGLGKKGNQ